MEIAGVDALLERLDNLDADGLREAALQGVKQGAKLMQAQCKLNCVYPEIRNGIITRVSDAGGKVTAEIVATKEESTYVEFGTGQVGEKNHLGTAPIGVTYTTRQRVIYVKRKNGVQYAYLTYGWIYPNPKATGEDDQFLFTMGQPARPYMYPAYKRTKGAALQAIRKRFAQLVRGE